MVSLRIPKLTFTADDVKRVAAFTSMTLMLIFQVYVFFHNRASFDSIFSLMRGVLP